MAARHRDRLPQLDGGRFITDGGLETDLIFNRGADLPEFAAFVLLDADREMLASYYRDYLRTARDAGLGFILETPTWRANPRWGERVGYSSEGVARANEAAVALMAELREESKAEGHEAAIVISGCVGPHDDGYDPEVILDADGAAEYHSAQTETFAGTDADQVTAITMTYVEEAIGVSRAASAAGIPCAISFTVETDGRLPSGMALSEAIEACDDAARPAYYMVNCAHPTHFDSVLEGDGGWRERILGVRPNASTRSHAELDEAEDLDDGDPEDLGARCVAMTSSLPNLRVIGGCCGTDHRHIAAAAERWATPAGA